MSNLEFFLYNFDVLDYIFILFLTSLVYVGVFWSSRIGILEPFTYYLVFSTFATSTGAYLIFKGLVDYTVSIQFLGTQILFITGYILFSRIKPKRSLHVCHPNVIDMFTVKVFFVSITTLTLVLQLYIYSKHGFPIFSDSRLNFVGEDLFSKLLLRVKAIFFVGNIISLYILLFNSKRHTYIYLTILGIYMIFSILDGAKSAIVTYLLCFGLFSYIYRFSGNSKPYLLLKKYGVFLMFLSIISALAVISIAGEADNGLMLLMSRFVMSGDVFYMAYPNDVYKLFIPNGEWYVNLFFSPASWFGLVDKSDLSPTLGYQLMSYHEGYEIFKGPNPRMNVFGLVYLGYYASFFYAFISGMIVGVLRNFTYDYFTRSNAKIIVYSSLVYCATTLEVDFFLFLASIINVFIMSIFVLFCKMIAICCLNKRVGLSV